MTRVYVYQAALLCEPCGEAVKAELDRVANLGGNVAFNRRWDSDDYPNGPHGNGGGEADSPQHCDHCHAFLDNPLTGDGEAYVLEKLADYLSPEGWTRDSYATHVAHNCEAAGQDVLAVWAERYGYLLAEPEESEDGSQSVTIHENSGDWGGES
jgi:hypothetical protein